MTFFVRVVVVSVVVSVSSHSWKYSIFHITPKNHRLRHKTLPHDPRRKSQRKVREKFSPSDFAPFFARDFPRTRKKWGSLWPWEGVELLINDAVRHDSHRDRALNLDASVAMLRLKQRRVSLFRETVIAHLRYSYCSDTSHGRLNHFFAVTNFDDLCLNSFTHTHHF